jgi:hypothetical protein
MKHPLDFIPSVSRKRVFIALLVWTLILMAVSQVINAPLRTPAVPASIVSFELARTPANAQAMVASWDAHARLFAAFGLGFDYLFMPSYAFTIALACLLAAGRHKGWFASLGAWLGWGVFAAALFDALENIGLWKSLLSPVSAPWPAVSFWCANFKFTLILLGILYGLVGWVWPKKR